MSAAKAESSAKRKRSKPHKLGDKKRSLSRKDSEEIVLSSQEIIEEAASAESAGEDAVPVELKSSEETEDYVPQSSRGRNEEFKKEKEHSPARPAEESVPQKCPNGGNSTPRGRGRPKGSKNKTFTGSSIMVSRARNGQYQRHTPPFPKHEEKREHPGGGDTPHRGRGRPKGSKNKTYAGSLKVTVQATGENTPKRTRGRPKGSLNKSPSKAALKQLKAGIPKMGRGRPKKILATNGAVVPKRARGRPKGSMNKIPSAKKLKGMYKDGGSDGENQP